MAYRPLFIVLLSSVIVLFLVGQPKVASFLFAPIRQAVWNGFADRAQKTQTLDAQDFWKMREFYSPGSFVFRKSGLPPAEAAGRLQEMGLSLAAHWYPFLTYSSPRVRSIEGLVDDPKISHIVSLPRLSRCIIQRTDTVFCETAQGEHTIIFVKPLEEMKTADAFFDYAREDVRKLIKGKYWFAATLVRTGK